MRLWAIRAAELLFTLMLVVGAGQLLGPPLLTPRIVAALERATGRAVSIDGEVYTDIFPAAKIEIFDLRLANAPGGSDRPMLTLHRLYAQLSWLALLQGRVVVTQLDLEDPDLLLETDGNRAGNWRFTGPTQPRGRGQAANGMGGGSLPVETINLHNARLTLRNGASGRALGLLMPDIHLASSDSDEQVRIGAQVQQGDQHGYLSLLTGPLADLRAAEEPWPFRIAFGGHGVSLLLDGTLTNATSGVGMVADLTGDVAAMDALAAFLPDMPLPALTDAKLRAHLSVELGAASIRATGIDVVSPALDGFGSLDWRGLGAGRLSGQMTLRKLDADALDMVAPPPQVTDGGAQQHTVPKTGDDGLLSTASWPEGLLDGPDLDLTIKAQQLRRRGQNFGPAQLHVARANSKLALAPVTLGLPGGELTGSFVASGTSFRPDIALSIDGKGARAEVLSRQLGLPDLLAAPTDLTVRIEGQGESPHALIESADGQFGLSAVGGEVETGVATGPLGPLLPQLGLSPRDATGRGTLRCLAIAGRISDGIATLSTLTLDSSALFLTGSGSLALGPQTLDLRVKPTLRLPPVTGIVIPARMTGPIADPRVAWDGPVPQGREVVAAVIGTATQLLAPDDCERGLAAARFGRSGQAAPPPASALERLPDAVRSSLLPELNKLLDRLP